MPRTYLLRSKYLSFDLGVRGFKPQEPSAIYVFSSVTGVDVSGVEGGARVHVPSCASRLNGCTCLSGVGSRLISPDSKCNATTTTTHFVSASPRNAVQTRQRKGGGIFWNSHRRTRCDIVCFFFVPAPDMATLLIFLPLVRRTCAFPPKSQMN